MHWTPDDLADDDRHLWDAMGEAKPRWSPMPTPGAPSELRAVDIMSSILGRPLIPWQRWAVRCLTEKRAGTRRYRYPIFDITAERQTGKTTSTMIVLATRAVAYRERRAFHTAQTGKDAVSRWADLVTLTERSAASDGWLSRRMAGSQRITWRPTSSWIAPFSPTPDSLHGYTPHDVYLDEAYAFSAAEGADLIGAISPAQQTLPDRQLIRSSTRGDARSTWHNAIVEAGRDDPSAGYLEYSIPDTSDPHDPSDWEFHPGLGHLIELEDLEQIHSTSSEGLWLRAFCNRPVQSAEPILDIDAWDAASTADLDMPPVEDCAIGYAVEGSHPSQAAIVAAWEIDSERIGVRVILSEEMPARDLAAYITGRIYPLRPRSIACDRGGLTRLAGDIVERELTEIEGWDGHRLIPAQEWVLASVGLDESIRARRIAHHPDDEPLDDAITTAERRRLGEAWALSHRGTSPLILAMASAIRMIDGTDTTTGETYTMWA